MEVNLDKRGPIRMSLECRSMYGSLRHVLVRHPKVAFKSQEHVARNWEKLGYTAMPSFEASCSDFDTFVDAIRESGATVHFHDDDRDLGLDSIYVHDPVMTIGNALVVCRMGKEDRSQEPGSMMKLCQKNDWPVLGTIEPPGILEGGDIIWLDEMTLAVGVGYRTNLDGIGQFRQITRDTIGDIIPVPLPHFRGPGDVLHLMSLISPIQARVAVVYRPLLPVPFLDGLLESGFTLIDVPEAEFDTLGCNVLALNPKLSIMADGNPVTRERIEALGIRVITYPPEEISVKGQGGPTCLTRPLERS